MLLVEPLATHRQRCIEVLAVQRIAPLAMRQQSVLLRQKCIVALDLQGIVLLVLAQMVGVGRPGS